MSFVHTILVPVDFSAHSAHAFGFALDLARQCQATLHVLHCLPLQPALVAPYGIVMPADLEQSCREAAVKRLEELADKASAAGVDAEVHESAAIPSEAILGFADDVGADLIVMGTRGLSGLAHVLIGSVADRVIRSASCPVVTLRADSEEG
jgi:nucleotide-binding universal stress UspA family protein